MTRDMTPHQPLHDRATTRATTRDARILRGALGQPVAQGRGGCGQPVPDGGSSIGSAGSIGSGT